MVARLFTWRLLSLERVLTNTGPKQIGRCASTNGMGTQRDSGEKAFAETPANPYREQNRGGLQVKGETRNEPSSS
jgi:hypothetical protein